MIVFDPIKHSYFLGDKRLTGVTTIIGVLAKPALVGWAARMAVEYVKTKWGSSGLTQEQLFEVLEEAKNAHTKKTEKAGEHGKDAHAEVEKYINMCLTNTLGSPLVVTDGKPLYDASIEKFVNWAYENVDHFLFSERVLHDPKLFIAGTADFAYVDKEGKRVMADFKTSGGIYGIDYFLQVAGYRMLAEQEGDAPYDYSCIVRHGKDGAFEVQKRYDYETDKEAFLACLTLYRAQATFKKPNY